MDGWTDVSKDKLCSLARPYMIWKRYSISQIFSLSLSGPRVFLSFASLSLVSHSLFK